MVDDVAHHDLKCCGGRKPRALVDVVGGKGVKVAGLVSVVDKALHHACDQRAGLEVEFGVRRLALGDRHAVLGVALAAQTDKPVVVLRRNGDDVEVDRGGKDAAVVVVGVVAGDLASAGNGEERNIAVDAVVCLKIVNGADIARLLHLGVLCAVELLEHGVQLAAFDFADKFGCFHASNSFMYG